VRVDESQPPPPPPAPAPPAGSPPPPSGEPVAAAPPPPPPTGAPAIKAPDNPIAIAGLTVSVLGIVLAVVVIGFFFGLIGTSLSAIALKRSRQGLGRRGMSIAGIIVGVLAMLLSVAGVFAILALANGEESTRNGIITNSTNETHPPQDDLDATVCGESNSGRIATTSVRITNRSESSSVYRIEVEWETEGGDIISSTNTTSYVGVDESITVDFVETSGRGLVDSCRVVRIDRSSLPIF